MSRRQAHSRDLGLTIVELTTYLVITAVLAVPLATSFLLLSSALAESDVRGRLEDSSRLAMTRVSREIRMIVAGTAVASNGGRTLQFQPPLGFDDDGVISAPPVTLELLVESTEQENGVDDDGDGLVDEGFLSRTDTGTGESAPIAANLDLSQSSFAVIDNFAVAVTLTSIDHDGDELLSVTRRLTTNPRN